MAETKDATQKTKDAVDQVAETTDATRAKAQEVYGRVKERLHDTVEHSGQALHETYEKVADTSLNDVNVTIRRYVRRQPGQALLVAAGVGLVAGLLLRGGRH